MAQVRLDPRRLPVAGAVVLLLTALALAAAQPASAQQIQGTLSNFDVHNDNDAEMTNLELDLRNIEPYQILSHYQGPAAWGLPPIVRDIGGTEVMWADFRSPIPNGGMRHFGLALTPDAPFPCGVQAYWTRHLKVVEIPIPWQTWRAELGGIVVDVIRLNPEFEEPVVVRREFATMPLQLPLDELNWDQPGIPWEPVPGDPTVLLPGETIELPIPVGGLVDGAVYVRYSVARERDPATIVTRFVNEARVRLIADPPVIAGTLSNFDVHNDTGKPVHDLELDLFGVSPEHVVDWYRGPGAWGLHPVFGDPAIDPIPGGTEIHWVDEWNPLPHCETRHFGIELAPGTPPPLVRAWWTRVVKVWQIPVPWQWWQTSAGEVVTDVIQLSDTFDEPVVIEREWATMPFPVELDQLVWDNPFIPWVVDPAGPVTLRPGDQTFLEIPTGPGDAAVLVRYTASRLDGDAPEVRFVNEALIDPSTSDPPQIVGSLSNFDVINVSGQPVTNLELDIRAIRPEQIVDWYRGPSAWGLHPTLHAPAVRRLPQTEVTWAAFDDPLPYCETRHFGLELAADAAAPCGVQAYWTQHLKVVEIPVPWQTWRPEPDAVIDVIGLAPEFPGPVWVWREFATLPFRLPLDELNWDNPAIPWVPSPSGPELLPPGGQLELFVPVTPLDRAVYVRYTVASEDNPEEIVTRFVNEAEIEIEPGHGRQLPSIVGELSNFDAHNGTGKPVHDLELDLRNIDPEEVLDWYRGPGAWGVDPRIRALPDGSGTEVTWIDDRNPMQHCETRHFGLRLAPGAPEPLVRAFWTRQVKVAQIPVPWQFWLIPGESIVRDVVQLSDTFIRPVVITREFATVDDLVPLDALNWDLAAPWQADPAGPITLVPGFQADLDIPVTGDTAAVLVRYEVTSPFGGPPVTRFVNEAMLGPGLVTGLHFGDDKDAFAWNSTPLSTAEFDVVRGDIAAMHVTGGIHGAACLADDLATPAYSDTAEPPLNAGFYYLVRAEGTGSQHGTYDTTTDPTVREGRDAEIGAADCP